MDDEEAGAKAARQGPPLGSGDTIHASVERLIASGKDLAEAESLGQAQGSQPGRNPEQGPVVALIATTGLMVGFSLLLVAGIVAIAPHVGGLLHATLIMIGVAFALAVVFDCWPATHSANSSATTTHEQSEQGAGHRPGARASRSCTVCASAMR